MIARRRALLGWLALVPFVGPRLAGAGPALPSVAKPAVAPARFAITRWWSYPTNIDGVSAFACELTDRLTGQTRRNAARLGGTAWDADRRADLGRSLLRLWAEETARIAAHGVDPRTVDEIAGFVCDGGPDCALCRDVRVEDASASVPA